MSNKKTEYRGRTWFISTYYDNVEDLDEQLKSLSNVFNYAYILHDKDIDALGVIKEPHYHIALILKSARNENCVRNYFEHEDNKGKRVTVLLQAMRSRKGSFDYLTHHNQPDKYQYSETDIFCSDFDYFKDKCVEQDSYFNIVDDMLNGCNLKDMVKLYGRDFVYHYSQIKLLVKDIILQEDYNRLKEDEEFFKKHNLTEIKGIEQLTLDNLF